MQIGFRYPPVFISLYRWWASLTRHSMAASLRLLIVVIQKSETCSRCTSHWKCSRAGRIFWGWAVRRRVCKNSWFWGKNHAGECLLLEQGLLTLRKQIYSEAWEALWADAYRLQVRLDLTFVGCMTHHAKNATTGKYFGHSLPSLSDFCIFVVWKQFISAFGSQNFE